MSAKGRRISLKEVFHMSAKDISVLYGCHIQTARRKLRLIKEALGKDSDQLVSLEEFANVEGVSIEFVERFKEQQIR